MPISFFLLIGAAVLLRIPAMEAAGRLRSQPQAALRLHGLRFAFDVFSCLVLLLALWRLPLGMFSGFDLALLRYGGAAVVTAALVSDGVGFLRRSWARLSRPDPDIRPET